RHTIFSRDWSSDVCSSDLLVFSVAGDIFLVLPQNRFLAGLVSFFLAHLMYIAAFSTRRAGWGLLEAAVLSGLAVVGLLLFRRMQIGRASCRYRAEGYAVVG